MGAPHQLLALCVLLSLSGAGAQDSKNCALWCPPTSKCLNSSACRCNPGFGPAEIITRPLESCDDINECALSTKMTCGEFADCKNTVGSYVCVCSEGYVLPSGRKTFSNAKENECQTISQMTPATSVSAMPRNLPDLPATMDPGTQSAPLGGRTEDVSQRMQDRKVCQGHSYFVDDNGNYICICPPGFKFSPEGPRRCTDMNECTPEQNPCHNSTHCINSVGSYMCKCRRGWKPVPGSPNGPNSTVCEEVDECSSGQHQCHNSTVCVNTQGSYRCRCRQGWKPIPGYSNGPKNTSCKEILFPAWTPPPGIHSKSLFRFFDKVQSLSQDFKPQVAKQTIKKLLEAMDGLLEVPGDIKNLSREDQHLVATWLLSDLEHTLRSLAQALPEGSFTYASPSSTELSLMVTENGQGNVTLGQSHARMLLDWAVATGAEDSDPTVVGILSSQHMEELLANASLALEPEKLAQLTEAHERPVRRVQGTLLSAVNSVFLSNTDTDKLASPVTFAFSHRLEEPGTELICAFWKSDNSRNGHWATTGCRKLGSGKNSTTCQCDHLSSFAVLMAHYQVEDWKLSLITKVGLSLSLVCLMLCILTFVLVRPIQSSRTTVHLHLCICLFLGSAIFLMGIENVGGQVGLRCRLVAGLLHYFFLAAFCWMSLEGVELYFLVVRVFQGQGLATRWQCLIGYTVPLIIVAISAAANSSGYGHTTHCWLDRKQGFLWSFLAPLAFVILCNVVIFVVTVWKLTQKFSEINPDMKKLRKARMVTITAVAQLFVLGCTWGFGLFLFSPESWHSTVLAYVFTVLNCLQGAFLYLLHCLLNKKVREEYWKWACTVTGNKYSEFASSTGGSSQQTRFLRPSESGM
ncbi:CD97 antigen isoform X2 [Heterocephalus glaber]|uniref:CD97 antigen isoform X2 n=1 Tax=Heterocephalus glaber TaxID=10181 RepID=A0AAX6SC69_HETGA|nr:CD97 antigen isoform X2 [Heterocephalus glaber]